MESRKRNRFESMNDEAYGKKHEDGQAIPRRKTSSRRQIQRALSLPNIQLQMERKPEPSIFPDVDVRSLRLAEVRSWKCDWMQTSTQHGCQESLESQNMLEKKLDDALEAAHIELSLDADGGHAAKVVPSTAKLHLEPETTANARKEVLTVSTATPTSSAATISPHTPSPLTTGFTPKKRLTLRLKLDDMPTSQQAENRANRAANRLLATRDAMSPNEEGTVSNMQKAMLALRLSSGNLSDNDSHSPHDGEMGRFSHGSSYSPNHGRFTTKSVSVSEAGIASPDSACLHLQENVVRVREVGRGASGVVYKAVHLPTLKVVAIKVSSLQMALT
ncbi:unnamed protein product [Aphanomyces euteiches]